MAWQAERRTVAVGEESKVTSIELFFDLVFVFALTQVTALMAEDLTARGAIRGILVVSVLWWCWVGYAWLGNLVRADEGVMRVALFVAMSGMFIAALTIPESFDDLPGGLSGPVVFAVCYFVVRATHFAMFWAAARGDAGTAPPTPALHTRCIGGHQPAARRFAAHRDGADADVAGGAGG